MSFSTTGMQITQSKNQFVEKVLRDKEGRLVRATFCVYENGGRVKARLVSVVYFAEKALRSAVFALSGFVHKKVSPVLNFKKLLRRRLRSLTINVLYQNGSKPRAPSFILAL